MQQVHQHQRIAPMLSRLLTSLLLTALIASAFGDSALPALRVLRDECIGCHKPGKAKGGLILNTREKMLKGGDNGAAVVEGKGKDSLLVQVLEKGHDPHMPPKKQLPPAAVAVLEAWVNEGAHWDARAFDELPEVKPLALSTMPASYQPVLALALSPDEHLLAIGRANILCVYDLTKPGRPLDQHLGGHTEAIQSVAWSSDGKWIATGGFRCLKIWDVSTWREVKNLSASLVGNVTALAFSQDNQSLFAADGQPGVSGFIHRVAFEEGKISSTWKAHEDIIYGLRLSPDGRSLASGAADRLAKLWDVGDGRLLGVYEGHTNHVLAVAFNKDGTQLATASADKEVKVWDIKSREQDVMLGDKKVVYTALAWTPDGAALAATNDKGSGSIYRELVKHTGDQRSETAKEKKLETVNQMLYCTAITRDGRTLFAGAHDGNVYLWNGEGRRAGTITER
ncbi:MAG: protein G-beta repeat-containing protein [Verrucomicrobiaceae bacterium]|nr:protein G-beta repeat-containing protein [Verrucomicrobiaceae bacterium]